MEKKEQVNNLNLLEDGWFFGNSLLSSKSKSSKMMVRCNSDPCPSSSTKEKSTLVSQDYNGDHISKMNNLLKTPSLPVSFFKDKKYELFQDDEVEEDEPSMGDLIMQAMPMPAAASVSIPRQSRRLLERTPSLPPCRGSAKEGPIAMMKLNNGGSSKKVSVEESSAVVQEKGPIAMMKLTRRASIDSSMLLPPKYTSKGTKQSASNSKNRPLRKLEPSNLINNNNNHNNSVAKTADVSKPQNLDKSKSLKTLSDLEIQELQGFKDLGFSFDNNDLSPSVTRIVPALQRRASLDSNYHQEVAKLRRPYLSEAWQKPSSPKSAPPVPKWSDPKAASSSSQDMKAQIKFWARAVASNVRQEC